MEVQLHYGTVNADRKKLRVKHLNHLRACDKSNLFPVSESFELFFS